MLHLTCLSGDIASITEILTRSGNDIHAVSNVGGMFTTNLLPVTNTSPQDRSTALHVACKKKSTSVVRLLCDYGADISAVDNVGLSRLL